MNPKVSVKCELRVKLEGRNYSDIRVVIDLLGGIRLESGVEFINADRKLGRYDKNSEQRIFTYTGTHEQLCKFASKLEAILDVDGYFRIADIETKKDEK